MNRIGANSLWSLLLLAVLLTSCSRKYRVEGNSSLINLDGKVLYLKMLQDGDWVSVDSSEVVHGCFKMKGPVDSVRMVTLYLNNEPLMPLVLENGRVKVDLAPGSFVARGTPLNDLLYDFIERRNELERALE